MGIESILMLLMMPLPHHVFKDWLCLARNANFVSGSFLARLKHHT
jgi:hypothetical protein